MWRSVYLKAKTGPWVTNSIRHIFLQNLQLRLSSPSQEGSLSCCFFRGEPPLPGKGNPQKCDSQEIGGHGAALKSIHHTGPRWSPRGGFSGLSSLMLSCTRTHGSGFTDPMLKLTTSPRGVISKPQTGRPTGRLLSLTHHKPPGLGAHWGLV